MSSLAAKYGTEQIAKEASLPLVEIASALVNLGLMVADKANHDHADHNAQAEQDLSREEDAAEMRATHAGLAKKAGAELAAIRAGRGLAKCAFPNPIPAMAAAAKGVAGSIGKALTPAAGATAAAALPRGSKLVGGMVNAAKTTAEAAPAAAAVGKAGIGWKGKALGAAGVLGASYGAYKGMQGVRNVMSEPAHETQRWGTERPVMHNVSDFGYPTF